MLDIEITVPPTDEGIDIVSLSEMRKHLRIIHTKLDDVITDAIEDAAAKINGNGELNRTIFPTTYKRWFNAFPGLDDDDNPKPILLPYPPLIEVIAVTIEDGSSPANDLVEGTDYVVKSGCLIPEIHPLGGAWPTGYTEGPRALSVAYRAGYEVYPRIVKRFVKILAAHYVENAEATINEPRQMMINRKVEYAIEDLRAALRVEPGYDDWNE